MKYNIENEKVHISVDSLGAELTSITDSAGYEYLWQGSEASWKGQSPVLFPIIGGLPDDRYFWNGREYSMASHGFARKSEWRLAKDASMHKRLVFELLDSEQTLRQYPFPFRFRLGYELDGASVTVSYEISNIGKESMPFSIGGHPGFRWPLEEGQNFSDWQLRFEKAENTRRLLKEGKLLTGGTEDFILEDGILPLNHEDFRRGAFILREFASESIILESGKSRRSVRVDFAGFPDLGLWTFPDAAAPFICIEPWFGVDSTSDEEEDRDFATKTGMVHLPPGEVFEAQFQISIS